MASKKIHFRQETPMPDKGHAKGANGAGYHGVQLETAPGRAGEAGYVRVKKA
jgi:hypothetical protein